MYIDGRHACACGGVGVREAGAGKRGCERVALVDCLAVRCLSLSTVYCYQ